MTKILNWETLDKKTTRRLKKLRKKYMELLYTSHNNGAGGVIDSKEYKEYKKIIVTIDMILSSRDS
jgi:hypothetical protein